MRLIEQRQERPSILKNLGFFRCEIMPKNPLETRPEDQHHIDAMRFFRRVQVQKLCIFHSTPGILKPEIPRHFQASPGAKTLHFPLDSRHVKAGGGVEPRRRHANSIACRSTARDARDSSPPPHPQKLTKCGVSPGFQELPGVKSRATTVLVSC